MDLRSDTSYDNQEIGFEAILVGISEAGYREHAEAAPVRPLSPRPLVSGGS